MKGPKKKVLKVKKSKGPKVRDEKEVKEAFAEILSMVKDGWTITEAAELTRVDKTALYKFISEEQKVMLREAKTTHAKYSAGPYTGKNKKPSAGRAADEEDGFRDMILDNPPFEIEWDD
jgi:hypothetical protein